MLRLRRYRVFVAIAVSLLLGLYYLTNYPFTSGPNWPGRSTGAFRNDVSGSTQDAASDKGRGRKIPKESMFKNSKTDSQIAIPGSDDSESESTETTKGTAKDAALEFPHKKPFEDPAIDERLPPGKHDPPSTSTTTRELPHFTKTPDNFPVPDDYVIKLPGGKPKSIPRIQHKFPSETTADKNERMKKLKRLRKTFLKHWAGYKEYAWDHDELKPVSGGYQDPFAGWRATLVDTLDMLWIMGLKEEFEEAVEEVGTVDFTTTQRETLPLFEVAIRYMGGLLAAYDISEAKYPVLLDKAKELGDVLMGAFDTPNRMPTTFYRWHPADRQHARAALGSTVLAEIGSLSMEFIRLAQITKNNRYYDAVARITDEFEIFQNNTKVPGLWPLNVDASGGCSVSELEKERKAKEEEEEEEAAATGAMSTSGRSSKKSTSGAKDTGRTLKDLAKGDDSKGRSKVGTDETLDLDLVNDVIDTEASKLVESSKGLAQAAKKATDVADVNEKSDARGTEDAQDSSKSLRKRAPPNYKDTGEASAAVEPKKKLLGAEGDLSDETESSATERKSRPDRGSEKPSKKAADKLEAKEGAVDLVDETTTSSKQDTSDADMIGHAGKASFADDDTGEPERPSAGSTGRGNGKQSLKDFPQVDDDDDDDEPSKQTSSVEKAAIGTSSDEKTKSADKSTFAEDAKAHGKTSAAGSKSKTGKSKDKLTSKHDEDLDEDEDLQPTFRHNKPMHKCVTRGLRSTYGDRGADKYTFGGMADSVYEYLPKAFLLLGGLEPQYQRMHEHAMSAAKEYLLFRTMTEDAKRPVYFTGDFSSQGFWNNETDRIQGTFVPHTGHLTCFQGAFIALAARAFRNEPDVDVARRLTDGCIWAYEQTSTGIMPELLDMVPCANLSGPCPWNQTKWWNTIDPWAKDKVAVFQQLAAQTDQDTIAAAKGDQKAKLASDETGKAADKLEDKLNRPEEEVKSSTAKHEARSVNDDAHANVPSELDHLASKRRPPSELHAPSNPDPDKSKTTTTSAQPQPTSIPEYFDQQIAQQRLAPGITKMAAREYILRPEAIESVFYLYRITGDPYFREQGWKMFEAIDKATSAKHGNSAISDVTAPVDKVILKDKAESFWTAETLKYFWLLFSDPELVSLDDWVFNTEAHPFRRPDLDLKREKSAERMRRRKGMGGNMVWDLD
ncbi:MAG: hypothetical protein Q9159_005245 [Coniocarpon cinnabarinum]